MRIITLICAASLGMLATAYADDAEESKKLFEAGQALQKEGKFAEACAKFAQSYELDRKASRPSAGTKLNLGDCAERDGQLRKAYLLFDDAAHEYERRAKAAEGVLAKDPNAAEAKRDLDRAVAGERVAREHAAALALKLAKVVIHLAEPGLDGLAVRIGDRTVPPAAEIVEYLDAGNVTITATAPGRKEFTTSARAESGKQVVVEVGSLVAIGGGGGGGRGGGRQVDTGGHRQKSRVRLALGLGGGGVALLGVSGILGLTANSKYDSAAKNCTKVGSELQCPPGPAADIDSAGKRADLATYIGIGGGLLVVGAAVVYFTAPRESVAITPTAGPSGAGVAVSGRF